MAPKPLTSATLKDIRRAVADYMRSEGCSCCQDWDAHREHAARLAKLLHVRKYSDGSGYNFGKHESKQKRGAK